MWRRDLTVGLGLARHSLGRLSSLIAGYKMSCIVLSNSSTLSPGIGFLFRGSKWRGGVGTKIRRSRGGEVDIRNKLGTALHQLTAPRSLGSGILEGSRLTGPHSHPNPTDLQESYLYVPS